MIRTQQKNEKIAIKKLTKLFQPAIEILKSDQTISSHLTTGVSNNNVVRFEISVSDPNWLLHPKGPDHHPCSTPVW